MTNHEQCRIGRSSNFSFFLLMLACLLLTPIVGCDDDPEPGDGDADSDADGDMSFDGDVDEDAEVDPNRGAEIEEPRECDYDDPPPRDYEATIQRTSWGIPHITGSDLGNASFGHGYVMAQENVCFIADQIVAARSERARYFGPGEDEEHIDHDFAYKALRLYEDAGCAVTGLSTEVYDVVAGTAAGYNQYLEDTASEDLPAACAGAEWVQPVTIVDLLAFYAHIALFGSGEPILSMIGNASPPRSGKDNPHSGGNLPDIQFPHLGSNGWALGSDRTENGRGMLLANPHFPWESDLRFFESHITVPGELDVYGVSLIGVPAILIGFNQNIAWTHTVADSTHFTLYSLELEEGDPEHYLYDGEVRRMTKRDYVIQVRQPDGSFEQVSRTVYRSHYGPILNLSLLGWTRTTALTYRDANTNNFAILDHFLSVNRASSLDEFRELQAEIHGIPWVNTMYADREGNAFYTDSCTVPNLSDDAIDQWRDSLGTDPLAMMAWDMGIPLMNGSDSTFEWQDDEGTVQPGTIPFADAPQLLRSDFVLNANDSHWLSNPAEPLEGYSLLYGPERTERSYRTRMNLTLAMETGEGSSSGEDGLFSLDELERTAIGDMRGLMGELLRDQVVERCDGVGTVDLDETEVDIEEACSILAEWDLRYNVDSVGAFLWREFLSAWLDEAGGTAWAMAFDPDLPVTTPNTLGPAGDSDPVLLGLARAILRIDSSGLDIAASLGEVQRATKGDETIPIGGGQWLDGTIAIAFYTYTGNYTLLPTTPPGDVVNSDTGLTTEGYIVNYGNSIVMALAFGDDGPEARAILTYSESPNESSDHFADQTRLYSEQRMRPVLYRQEDIEADLVETVVISRDAE